MKVKKLLVRVFTMVVALLVLLNMGGMTPKAESKGPVVIWTWGPYATAAHEAIEIYKTNVNPFAEFEIMEMESREVLEQKLNVALAAGEPPDIVIAHDSEIRDYVNTGCVAPLTPYLNLNNYMGFKASSVTYNGDIYGVPYSSEPAALYYNKDLMDMLGYDLSGGVTWDEFHEIGHSVREHSYGYYPNFPYTYLFPVDNSLIQILMQSADVRNLDSLGTKETMQLLDQFYYEGLIDPEFPTCTRQQLIDKLWNGQFATVIGGPEWVPIITEISEEFMQEWRVINIPKSDIFTKDVYLGGYSWMVLETANKYQAIDFVVRTFGTSDDLAEIMAEKNLIVPVLNSAYNRLALLAAAPNFCSTYGGHVIEFLFTQSQGISRVRYTFYPQEAGYILDKYMTWAIQGHMSVDEAFDKFCIDYGNMNWMYISFLWVITG